MRPDVAHLDKKGAVMNDFLKSLGVAGDEDLAELNRRASTKTTPTVVFPCENCAGTGKTYKRYGYRNPVSYERTCPACKGKGSFKTSAAVRQKNREQAKAREARNQQAAKEAFEEANPGLYQFLIEAAGWSGFAKDMAVAVTKYGTLSEKQLAACQNMRAKVEARKTERQQQANRQATSVGDVSRIRKMFDDALAAGKNKRALLAARFDRDENGAHVLVDGKPVALAKIKLTPARAPRTEIWVKVEGEFCGGINEEGRFKANRNAPAWLVEELERLAANPEQEARLYGKATGVCCCCGAELTNPASIEAGIGPICAEKWNL